MRHHDRKARGHRAAVGVGQRGRRRPLTVDRLEERALLAVTSTFAAGVLTVTSNGNDAITVAAADGNVRVNGADPGTGAALASAVTTINVTGGPVENVIDLSGVSGTAFTALTAVTIDGGAGNDTITGSALADSILGGAGNDTIFGLAGNDTIRGGAGNDSIVGGQGADSLFGGTAADEPTTLIGLDAAGRNLVRFSASAPDTVTATAITGIPIAETIVGFDTRPATGELIALTNEGGVGRLYTIDPATGVAGLRFVLTADGTDATDPYTALVGTDFGIDFNPVPDRLRVVSDADQNLRINVDNGQVITDGPLAFAAGDPNAAANPAVTGSAYTNGFAPSPRTPPPGTTLYGIDATLNILVRQDPPNNGTLNTVGDAGLGVDPTAVLGFEILPASNRALASLVVGGAAGLYEIDLTTGAATLLDPIGAGATPIGGLAVLSESGPLSSDDDTFTWNNTDGSDVIEGGVGRDTQLVNGSTVNDAFEVGPGAGGRLLFRRTSPGPFSLDIGTVEVLTIDGRRGDDTVLVSDLTGVASLTAVNVFGSEGDDALAFADNGSLLAGFYDGGEGSDTISYAGYTTAVTVNLNTGQQFFTARLDGAQEVPPTPSPATGTGTFTLNQAGTELTFVVNYEDLVGQLLGGIGAHFHAPAPPGQNAAIVRGLTPDELNGLIAPSGVFDGVWRSTDAQPLTAERVQQLRDGLVYFNIHTSDFPGGEIRGQILLTGTEATGPGVGSLRNVENVIGGQAADTITGGPTANSIVGGRGNDTITGGAGIDTIIWNNGDGSDVIDGGEGIDTVQVNGGAGAETFDVSAGAGGRLTFRRTDPAPFSLDIGNVEGLELDGGLGRDTVSVGDLTGVAGLTRLDLDGGADDDVINATALPAGLIASVSLRGGPGNDTLFGSAGADSLFGGAGNDTITGGRGNDTIEAGVTAEDARFVAVTSANTALVFSADAADEVEVITFTGLQAGETVIGADYRPSEASDLLYVLTDQGRIYTATPDGALTLKSTLAADPTDTTSPFAGLDGTEFGVDFNPVPDRLRVVSNTRQNLRINVDTGAVITDDPLAFAAGDENAAAQALVTGVAYTNGIAGATTTTLFDIDSGLDVLARQDPPNAGRLNTIGGLGVDATNALGFDILPGAEQTAFASLVVGGVAGLYRIDLATGRATLVGTIGEGTDPIVGLAAAPDNDTVIWNNGDGSDTIEGGLGVDTSRVNGGAAGETFEVSAGEGGRLAFRRTNPAPFALDHGAVERLEVFGNDGDDTLTIGDLSSVEGVIGLTADLGAGNDRLDGSALGAALPITGVGGAGNDTLIGGPGDDTLNGNAGNNLVVGGGGTNRISNGRSVASDFDGDGISDFAAYSFSEDAGIGVFEVRLSSTGETTSRRLGGPDAFPVTGDYDGDGRADFAVYEFAPTTGQGRFTIVDSTTGNSRTVDFGGPNDFPVAGDYDGDGRTDVAVYGFSPAEGFSRFAVINSTTGAGYSRPFGGGNDFPVAGDYDGDGRTDIAVYGFSPLNGFSRFAVLPSSSNDLTNSQGVGGFPVAFGGLQDSPVSADYDGNGQTDFVVFGVSPQNNNASRFAILPAVGGSARAVTFGTATDRAVGTDFNGDGRTDIAVFGPGAGTGTDTDVARFRYQPTEGAEAVVQPFGGRDSIALPPSSGLFEIQPPPASASASQRAGGLGDVFDLALDDLLDEEVTLPRRRS